ncbi:amidohydrolase family protein [Novosphingobium pentaromativorans]|uniref:Amidohydrolase-related domain-containing protein n=1 Tax=Novosphingobium pentaromativorans US6-1 TaxID=1088721 RepID=G6EGL6_9SPHN|nr:amidohydrolase family protein [Novosphingobium pentaromativorans]AIT82157.1 hypothetical protein JI59_21770 [Novosphingobium pentaromativorans US6-1]EHJ59562.1 hypothetical protein NSU_3445 [Novosphingobium pentaromativorans US6-1]
MTIEGKIALEEHFLDPAQDAYFDMVSHGKDPFTGPHAVEVMKKLRDTDAARIADMDRIGIEIAVLSYYNGSSVQLDPDHDRAESTAQAMNDFLAARIAAHPDRFKGWAALPVQDPQAAARELVRCVNELGFVGAMINGHTQGEYLDEPRFLPIWEKAAELNVPIYLHPGITTPDPVRSYAAYPALEKPAWGWSVETGLHALRIILGGVFDRFPDMQLVLGHMGELLPFHCARFDQIEPATQAQKGAPKHAITHYIHNNIMITTSGNLSPATMIGAILEMGADRILYATDYPLADADHFNHLVETAPISHADLMKICRDNSRRLFGL